MALVLEEAGCDGAAIGFFYRVAALAAVGFGALLLEEVKVLDIETC